MLRLGHIDYSNCLPVHHALLEAPPAGLQIIYGTPAQLNQALHEGSIDVAPCSSIEYARHMQEYRLLPGLVIGADGAVRSIRLESRRGIEALAGGRIALPTASATSVVLLRVLLERRFGLSAQYEWFAQESCADPLEQGFDAALWIGDIALRRPEAADRHADDLGARWKEWTGLPFAFAVWQTRLDAAHDHALADLTGRLHASREQAMADPLGLAQRHAHSFGMSAPQLADYWRGLRFELDARMLSGLRRFYTEAAAIGEIDPVTDLHFVRNLGQ